MTQLVEKFSLIAGTDHWEEEDIIKTIELIHGNGNTQNARIFKNKDLFPEFEKRYTYLFKIACEDNIDQSKLSYMMSLRRKILADTLSVESASKTVGDKFFREYVAPVVKEVQPAKRQRNDSS